MSLWTDEQVLVTVGAGPIGSHLVERLIEARAKVRAANNFNKGSLTNLGAYWREIDFLEGDLTDLDFAMKSRARQYAAFHLAVHVGGAAYNFAHQATMF